jgi:hypothetical protein
VTASPASATHAPNPDGATVEVIRSYLAAEEEEEEEEEGRCRRS